MSTRPRPRPKPRPRVPNASSPAGGPSPLPAASPLVPVSINIDDDEDEDARFLKNRNRTLQSWKKLEKLTEEKDETKKHGNVADHGSESEGQNSAGSPRRRKHQKVGKHESMPSWTKDPKAILELSSDSDENDLTRRDDDISTPKASRMDPRSRIHKKQRSRSRSITPPPALPQQAIMHARQTIQRVFNNNKARAGSPSIEDDDDSDDIELDPELARIAQQVQIEAARHSSLHPTGSRSPSPVNAGGGPEVVGIKVRWKPHPLDPNGKKSVWAFEMKRTGSFRLIFDEVADIAEVLVDHIVLTYEGKRVFPSASPHGIGVWARAELEACDKITFEYLQAQRHRSPGIPNDRRSPSRASTPAASDIESLAASEADDDDDDEKEENDTLKLTIRSALTKPLVLTVKPTTKCSAILKAFLKRNGLSEKYPSSPVKAKGKKGKASASSGPALVFDGEKLSPDAEISSADVEDGDVVDVTGL